MFKCFLDHNEAMCSDFAAHLAENKVIAELRSLYTRRSTAMHARQYAYVLGIGPR